MKTEIGSYVILYNYYNFIKLPANNNIKNQIAEQLSSGLKFGQFHYCFDGITYELGWWVISK